MGVRTIFDFARGPGLRWALIIMVAGAVWRSVHFAIHRHERDRYWAHKAFHRPSHRMQLDSYAMHAGLLIVLFGFSGHITFIASLFGVEWRALPITVVLFAGAVSLTAMVVVLIHRIRDPEPSIFSPFDDYFSWTVVFLAMLTGMLCYPHVGGTPLVGPSLFYLTAHLLAVELLMIWLPFGKLIHVMFMPGLRLLSRIHGWGSRREPANTVR